MMREMSTYVDDARNIWIAEMAWIKKTKKNDKCTSIQKAHIVQPRRRLFVHTMHDGK